MAKPTKAKMNPHLNLQHSCRYWCQGMIKKVQEAPKTYVEAVCTCWSKRCSTITHRTTSVPITKCKSQNCLPWLTSKWRTSTIMMVSSKLSSISKLKKYRPVTLPNIITGRRKLGIRRMMIKNARGRKAPKCWHSIISNTSNNNI